MRKMATIRLIDQVKPIEDADSIEAYNVDGWWLVDRVGAYKAGDKIIFVEPDSWVPHELAPFLSKGKEPREYEGIKGERLRTVKLRKQISQGLLLPLSSIGDLADCLEEGTDVSEYLGIIKWEAPIHASLGGIAKGNFPSYFRKTDQERVQNLKRNLERWIEEDDLWEVTLKLHGSSMTVGFSPEGEFIVCSRNLQLDLEQEGNTFVDTAKRLNLEEKLRPLLEFYPKGFAVQGELMGEGINGNQEKIVGHDFFVFDIYDVGEGSYMKHTEREMIVASYNFNTAPIIAIDTLKDIGITGVEDALNFAEGKSMNPLVEREGVVFKRLDGLESFKAVSRKWLLKNGE